MIRGKTLAEVVPLSRKHQILRVDATTPEHGNVTVRITLHVRIQHPTSAEVVLLWLIPSENLAVLAVPINVTVRKQLPVSKILPTLAEVVIP